MVLDLVEKFKNEKKLLWKPANAKNGKRFIIIHPRQ